MTFPAVSYALETPAGYPGMPATTEPHRALSMIVGASSADIAPG